LQNSWPYFTVSDSRLPKPGAQVPIFISPRNRVAQLYPPPPALASLSVAFYNSQGCGGGIRPCIHTAWQSSKFTEEPLSNMMVVTTVSCRPSPLCHSCYICSLQTLCYGSYQCPLLPLYLMLYWSPVSSTDTLPHAMAVTGVCCRTFTSLHGSYWCPLQICYFTPW
jgi:hypothetical protein